MQPSSRHDAVRRILTTAGITGAALTLSMGAALPALACHSGGDSGGGSGFGGSHDSHGDKGGKGGQQGGHHDKGGGDQGGSDQGGGKSGHEGDHHDKGGGKGGGKSGHEGNGGSGGSGGSGTDGHNPPGNNGTVFIHDVAGDFSPHNVPHVGCTFYADLFGFDNAQQVTVSFAGQAPTGMGTALGGSWTGTVSTDDAGGAGNDFDLELPFSADTLGVTSLGAPHPKQGYHVKMTVLTNEPGGKKSKVFWIAPCAESPDTPDTTGGDDTTTGGDTTGGTDDTPTDDNNTPDTTDESSGGS